MNTPHKLISFLRPLEATYDLAAVADLVEMCFAENLDADGRRYIRQMRAAASNPRTARLADRFLSSFRGYVWTVKGKIVGNLNLLPVVVLGNPAYLIANVAVHPDYRRQGIASALTEAGLRFIRKKKVHAAWLQVKDDNQGAIQLYKNFGFVEKAHRTTWHSTPTATQAPLVEDVSITSRKSEDWPKQREWLIRTYPQEVRWNLALRGRNLRPGAKGFFSRLFSDKQFYQWSAHQGGELIGTLSWQSSYGQADQLWLAAPPETQELAILSLLPNARETLSKRRKLAVNYPAGEAVQAFEDAGFKVNKTLIWMQASM